MKMCSFLEECFVLVGVEFFVEGIFGLESVTFEHLLKLGFGQPETFAHILQELGLALRNLQIRRPLHRLV